MKLWKLLIQNQETLIMQLLLQLHPTKVQLYYLQMKKIHQQLQQLHLQQLQQINLQQLQQLHLQQHFLQLI